MRLQSYETSTRKQMVPPNYTHQQIFFCKMQINLNEKLEINEYTNRLTYPSSSLKTIKTCLKTPIGQILNVASEYSFRRDTSTFSSIALTMSSLENTQNEYAPTSNACLKNIDLSSSFGRRVRP